MPVAQPSKIPLISRTRISIIYSVLVFSLLLVLIAPFPVRITAAGATTTLHIVKYNPDGKTVKTEKTVDYKWMINNLPVQGDGVTHYYHQGPVFEGDVWDPTETLNLKDKGAVKGTAVRDLCDLAGGMEEGGEIIFKAVDGFALTLAYANIYNPPDVQGQVVLCWYKGPDAGAANGESREYGYPADDEYNSAMQLIIMAKIANSQGQYVFGNQDMKISMPEEKYQHFYSGLPSTNGLSGKWISEIRIYSKSAPPQPTDAALPYSTQPEIPWRSIGFGLAGIVLVIMGIVLFLRNK
jgi:hypothetical protein